MGAPKNNQYWKLRSKHGKSKLFATPDLLWEAACSYFEWADTHKYVKTRIKKSKAIVLYKQNTIKERPYTLKSLCLYIGASSGWWFNFKNACIKQKQEDFIEVISRIEDIVETQQFEGACVGVFNPNIIARMLGVSGRRASIGNDDKVLNGLTINKAWESTIYESN